MTRKDFALFSLLSTILLGLLAPAWFNPTKALFNFGDLYAYHYPLRHLAASSLQQGHMPFWNPYIFGGLPLLANSQSALFYPVSLFGFFFPLTLALSWDYAFHLLWAALGLWLLCRRAKLSSPASLILATLYALCPFLIYRITEGIPTLLASLSWAPWCYLAWMESSWLLAALWSLQFLSGHPQFMLLNALGMGVVALSQKNLSGKALSRLIMAGLSCGFLAAIQWWPAWQFASLSVRRTWPAVFSLGYSLDPKALWTWIWPNAFGNPVSQAFIGSPSVFFETSAPYLGLAGLMLAGLGLWRGRSKAGIILIALGIFLALGGHNPLYRAIISSTSLGLLRTPSRALLLCLWGLLILAGIGLRWIDTVHPRGWIYATLFCVICVELISWDKHFLKSQDAAPFLRINAEASERTGDKPFRIMTDPAFASPDKSMLYRAMNVNGYEAFYLEGFAAYAAQSEGHPAADASRSYLSRYDSPQMGLLGVNYFISQDGKLHPNTTPNTMACFADDSGPKMEDPPKLFAANPQRWIFHGRKPSWARQLIISVPFYPGWKARLNQTPLPLHHWGSLLQTVDLPPTLNAGQDFRLTLNFKPTLWLLWTNLSILSWALWLWLAARKLTLNA